MSDPLVLHLRSEVTAARQARAFVRAAVGPGIDDDLLQDVLVVTSELVTNAVMHAGTESELEVLRRPDEVELRVTDGDDRLPARRALVGLTAQGRGLALMAALSRRWGVEERPGGGKTVWAVLSLRQGGV